MATTTALRELSRAVHRGDLAAARRVLDFHRPDVGAVRDGMRQAERDIGRDPPLPPPPVSQTDELAALRVRYAADAEERREMYAAQAGGRPPKPKKRRKAA